MSGPAQAWTQALDVALVCAVEESVGADVIRSDATIDWGRALQARSWPAGFVQATLQARWAELSPRWSASGVPAGSGSSASYRFADMKRSLEERGLKRKEPAAVSRSAEDDAEELSHFVALVKAASGSQCWRMRINGVDESFSVDLLNLVVTEKIATKELLALTEAHLPSKRFSDARLGCRALTSEFARRGYELYARVPLPLEHRTVAQALLRLNVPVPACFATLCESLAHTRESERVFVECLAESRGAGPLQVEFLTGSAARIGWRDRGAPLCVVVVSHAAADSRSPRYASLLRIEEADAGRSLVLWSPVPACLTQLRVDARRCTLAFDEHGRVELRRESRVVEFDLADEAIAVDIPLPPARAPAPEPAASAPLPAAQQLAPPTPLPAPPPHPPPRAAPSPVAVSKCAMCGASLGLSWAEQAAHVSVCNATRALLQANESEAAAQTRVDDLLRACRLERCPVTATDGLSLFRALLLAQGKACDEAATRTLLRAVWGLAAASDFAHPALSAADRRELSAAKDPEACLSPTASASLGTAFGAFLCVACLWAARAISRDLYVISDEASVCTLYPPSLASPSSVTLSEVSCALSSALAAAVGAVALVQWAGPTPRFEWARLVPAPLLTTPDVQRGSDAPRISPAGASTSSSPPSVLSLSALSPAVPLDASSPMLPLAPFTACASPPPLPSPALPAPGITDLLAQLTTAVAYRRVDDAHKLCEAALAAEGDASLSKQERLRLLRLNHDVATLCHANASSGGGGAVCPIVAGEARRAVAHDEGCKQKSRCSMATETGLKCGLAGTWARLLYACVSDEHKGGRYFHAACAGYGDAPLPFSAQLLCPACIDRKRGGRDAAAFRRQHLWEALEARAEVYRQGFRCVEVPRNGLSFFTVLCMLAESTSMVPESGAVREWLLGRPYSLLLAAANTAPADTALAKARAEILHWPSRSLEQWRTSGVNAALHGAIFSALPALLQRAKILGGDCVSYAFDAGSGRGSWRDLDGHRVNVPLGARFALLITEQSDSHCAVLERHANAL